MITKISTVNMSHEDWLEARKHSIGGSDASAILGLNPYQTAYGLWLEKTGQTKGFEGNVATKVGTYLEEFVAKMFEDETGKKVRKDNSIIKNDAYPFAHANIDRAVVGEDAGLEIKTTNSLNVKKFKGGEFPDTYYCQCVHYMAVTGKAKWYLAVLIGNSDFRIFTIERDEEEIKALMDAEKKFWECVETNSAPAFSGAKKDTELIGEQYPVSNPVSIDMSAVSGSVSRYMELGKQIKELEVEQELLKQNICNFMGVCEKGTTLDYKISWKTATRNSFDSKKLLADHPEIDASLYTKTSSYRTFKVS